MLSKSIIEINCVETDSQHLLTAVIKVLPAGMQNVLEVPTDIGQIN
jgi:hypothetical protein